jgi:hypothetical protein
MQRSKLAEIYAADLASIPLVAECVLLNPAFLDRRREREVCDLLLVLKDRAFVVQMKTQDKPRTGEKLARWVEKEAKRAANQTEGAIRTLGQQAVWCEHPRRGRVDFQPGSLKPLHALVIVESSTRVAVPASLPKTCDGVPISYLSLNDFLNLVNELRAFPEIALYLAQRSALARSAEIPLGAERTVYATYLANEGGFGDCRSYDGMAQAMTRFSVNDLLLEKAAADRPARVFEQFVDSLAERIAHWDEGLPPELARGFDPPEARMNYLRIQEEFCELKLVERRALGRQLLEVRSKLRSDRTEDMAYTSARFDSNPERLYVVAASCGIARPEVLKRAHYLLTGGLAFYRKDKGVIVADRDGKGFEFTLMDNFQPSPEHVTMGEYLFGKLRTFSFVGSIGPSLRRFASGTAQSPSTT